eukprot:1159926-Pelagomonas_calceolata.AAC.2
MHGREPAWCGYEAAMLSDFLAGARACQFPKTIHNAFRSFNLFHVCVYTNPARPVLSRPLGLEVRTQAYSHAFQSFKPWLLYNFMSDAQRHTLVPSAVHETRVMIPFFWIIGLAYFIYLVCPSFPFRFCGITSDPQQCPPVLNFVLHTMLFLMLFRYALLACSVRGHACAVARAFNHLQALIIKPFHTALFSF